MRTVLRQLADPPDLALRPGHRQLLREYHGSQAQRLDIEQDPGEMRDVAAAHGVVPRVTGSTIYSRIQNTAALPVCTLY